MTIDELVYEIFDLDKGASSAKELSEAIVSSIKLTEAKPYSRTKRFSRRLDAPSRIKRDIALLKSARLNPRSKQHHAIMGKRIKTLETLAKKASRKRAGLYVGTAGLLALGGVGNVRDAAYAVQQYKNIRSGKGVKIGFGENLEEIDRIITETVTRTKAGNVGGVTRWRRRGRPNPMRSMRAKQSAKRNRHKRKLAMRKLMNSPKGQALRRFRSKIMKGKKRSTKARVARNRPPGPRASKPRVPRTARRPRRRTVRRPRRRTVRRTRRRR
jgi:hypothetical protein